MAQQIKKIALIGVGTISQVYLDLLPDFPDVHLDSIVDPNVNHTKQSCYRTIPHYHHIEEMLKNKQPHMAIICTPPSTHRQLATSLLLSDVHCLIEKPFTPYPEDALAIQDLAIDRQKTIAVSAKYRTAHNLQLASQWIQQGKIGTLKSVENIFSGKLNLKDNWRTNPNISGGGVWMDNGAHALDVVQTVAGPIQKIKLSKISYIENGVEEEVTIEAQHTNQVQSRIHLSWKQHIQAPIVHCIGSKGELKVHWDSIEINRNKQTEIIPIGYDKQAAFHSVIQQFLNRCDRAEYVDEHGLDTISWIQAAYRSIQTKQWEPKCQ